MPGVIVRTATRSGPSTGLAPESARYFVAGLTERGSTTEPVRVRSMAEYEQMLGARVPYGTLYDDLKTYFEEGGAEAYVARVVGPAATVGKLTLNDRAGTPAPTLDIEAASPGAWSADLSVEVANGTAAGTYKLLVYWRGERVETWDNLTTPADAVTALAGSAWVRAKDKGSPSSPPDNQPAILARTPLSAGDDDRAAVTATHVTDALARFGPELGSGAVACPGYTSAQVGEAVIAHCKANRRIGLLATAQSATVQDALNAAAEITADGEHAGLFYPWITVPDGASGTRTISPEGYVAACRARAHTRVGPWRAPAGEIAQARYVLGPSVELTRAEGDQLDEGRVSAIRRIVGTTRLYGWRSLSADTANYGLLIGRDMLNYLAVEAERLLESFVFETIDGKGQMLGRVQSTLVGLLDPIRQAGGLYERIDDAGAVLDPGYSVDVGPAVNTVQSLAANEVRAVVAVRVSPVGTLIDLTITKAALTASV
ncbi:hypothetical protein LI90_4372 (plasmid) [Carbonactinospora thermoautotrophica]|uniref:Tail sheath protein n=1 Tax=Carbonactinospora thermoautotrophica TaxID=1469144 RepID=A0A132MHR3_9ACTN|nr:hypothetical protein [Carbonactinospora thermoautotrophica]KWW97400.1 hypothetical protein LI90_4372 [Carbonactinospora thermoautotrophica]